MSEEPELIMPCELVQCLQTYTIRLPRLGKQYQGDCLTGIKIVDDDPHVLEPSAQQVRSRFFLICSMHYSLQSASIAPTNRAYAASMTI
jgi:hypothetical protein